MAEDFNEIYKKLMSNYISHQKQFETECVIDWTKPESFTNNTLLMIKFTKFWCEWNEVYKHFHIKLLTLKRTLFEHYKKTFDLSLKNKDEIELFIFSDPQFIQINKVLLVATDALKFIEQARDTIKSRGYEINRWMEYQKFLNGK